MSVIITMHQNISGQNETDYKGGCTTLVHKGEYENKGAAEVFCSLTVDI